MISYLCDTSFEGLLTAIYFAYSEKNECQVLSGSTYQNTLGETLVEVVTDYELYRKMESYISKRCGVENLMNMYKAFLGEDQGVADLVFRYFKTAMKMKLETIYMHAEPTVSPVLKIANRVSAEGHKMQGFIRFKKLKGNLMYAGYSPTSNVTPLVAPHFADRMNSFNWIIHDTTRNVFAVYNKKECIIGHSVPSNLPDLVDIEADFEDLLHSYTVHVAIRERLNLKLQMNLMPKKYWHFLTEKNYHTF
ncbi:MAG: TIGR03915 family putative DNA repair protein [Clostridiales bacterium]|nr:TIGR03915 family putative DNA repair protein [Clostridiales bacterium]